MHCYSKTDSAEYLFQSGDFANTYGAIESMTKNSGSTLDLKEVVVSGVAKTAFELFGEAYTALEEKIEYKNNVVRGLMVLPLGGMATAVGFGIYSMVVQDINWLMNAVYCIAGTMGSAFIPSGCDSLYKRKAEVFLGGCHTITEFYNDFEEFKKDPQDFKVVSLFSFFEKIRKNDFFNFIPKNDTGIFASAGKLLVLDAAVKLIEEKNESSPLAQKWNEIMGNPMNSQELHKELWKSFGIEKPADHGFFKFNELRKDSKVAGVIMKVVSSFKFIINQNIAQNTI